MCAVSYVDGLADAFVWVDASEKQQVEPCSGRNVNSFKAMPWWIVATYFNPRRSDALIATRCVVSLYARYTGRIRSDENPCTVVTSGVATRRLYVSGRKSKWLCRIVHGTARGVFERSRDVQSFEHLRVDRFVLRIPSPVRRQRVVHV